MERARRVVWFAVLVAFAAWLPRSAPAWPVDDVSPGASAASVSFEEPVRLKAGDDYVAVESPGYACPTLADVDNDGLDDLVVGQFRNGNMQFCRNIAQPGAMPQYAAPQWLMTGSDRAVVPGVW